jgi:TolA-binding protein
MTHFYNNYMRGTMSKDNTPKKNAEKTVHHHNDELAEVKAVMDKYGKNALTVLLIVMISVAGFHFYTARKKSHAAEATIKLNTAQSIPDLEAIVANYGDTQPAQMAMIALAKQYYETSDYEAALNEYDKFIAQYPESRLVEIAKLGRVFCIETRGSDAALEESAQAYAAFVKDLPKSFLVPQALFGQARCLSRLNRKDEARIIYEDFITNNPDSAWILQAQDFLDRLGDDASTEKSVESTTPEVIEAPVTEVNQSENPTGTILSTNAVAPQK